MLDCALVRCGELYLKQKETKKRFEERLLRSLRNCLKLWNFGGRVEEREGRILLIPKDPSDVEEVAKKASKLFGVVSTSPCRLTSFSSFEELIDSALAYSLEALRAVRSFGVRVKRVGSHDFSSRDVEVALGQRILEAIPSLRVDLKSPERWVRLEIRGDTLLCFSDIYPGPGGLPYATQGKLLALLSGGIDSAVAMWLMMKRGCEVGAVHFKLTEEAERACLKILGKLREYCCEKLKLWSVEFRPILERVAGVTGKYTCILCKRSMLRIATNICKLKGYDGLITGESLGQVASQSLQNLSVIGRATQMPLYRPLIGMNKEEIITLAKRIETFDLSIKAKTCEFVPKRPVVEAKSKAVERLEKGLGAEEVVWKSFSV